jgi:hypothetical protein
MAWKVYFIGVLIFTGIYKFFYTIKCPIKQTGRKNQPLWKRADFLCKQQE